MLLDRLRIRGKLALLVAIPLLSMVALAVPVVVDRTTAAGRASDTADLVRVAGRVGNLIREIQQERLLSVGYLLGLASRADLELKSATVADRVADLRATFGSDLPGSVTAALDGVGKLAELRTAVLARRATPEQIMNTFTPIDTALIDSLGLQHVVDTRTAAGRQVLALDFLLRADEHLSVCATLIVLVAATKNDQAVAAYISTFALLRANNERFNALATHEQVALALSEADAAVGRTSTGFVDSGGMDPIRALAGKPAEALFPAASSMITIGQFIEKKVVVDVIAEVTGQQRRALATAYGVGALGLFILLVVVLLSLLVARTVARPLIRLTRSADRVARLAEAELVRVADDETEATSSIRLDPVDVHARDEIGDLARAFDRVQGTAARLVERQVVGRRNVAQMLGHVGRRTQNLVGRQLSLIDRLEHEETDPARLQHLYRLDHVSSRLRRNASSLVVLSGSAGTNSHVAPLPLADVVRLALGEIEAYTRVDVLVRPDIRVAPAAIGDLVLTLAELMENATTFSPPHTRVTVTAERLKRSARITLVDQGIGLSAERIAEENARLTQRERLDLAPTEVLGLFVVGRLARRHSWRVELSPTPGGGMTVNMEIGKQSLIPTLPVAVTDNDAIDTAAINPGAGLVAGPVALAGVATAAPSRAGGEPAAPLPVRAGGEPAAPLPVRTRPGRPLLALGPSVPGEGLATSPAAVDEATLGRATRLLESGQPWDAFAINQLPPAPTSAPAAAGAAAPRPGPAGPGPADSPGAGVRSAAAPASAPAEPDRPPLRQRVPGAQLPTTGPTRLGPAGADADPQRARALVEEFEAGVRRAERGFASRAGRAEPIAPGGLPLNRRVPGATLGANTPTTRVNRQPVANRPSDPDEVRNLITQFESGVARAMSEISSDHRTEEGTQ